MKDNAPALWHEAKLRPKAMWRYRLWRPDHRAAMFGRRGVTTDVLESDESHLRAAASWLAHAQDVSDDGGVVGRYRLDRGWTSSYPETTGYIIPTFLRLAQTTEPSYLDRAARCVAFLLDTQLPSGAFPAGEIAANTTTPSPFNTAQIITGLLAWHRHGGDTESLAAAHRAARWLVAEQDEDGAWRTWFYNDTPATYAAHLSCWLAELGVHESEGDYLNSASRHLDWVLAQRNAQTGWFDCCGFTEQEQHEGVADLHTVAYTLAGILRTARLLERDDGIGAVIVAAGRIAEILRQSHTIPGMFDSAWRARVDSVCLTGCAQLALVWIDLFHLDGDTNWLDVAWAALDRVKCAQLMNVANPDFYGAIPGSDPMWGWYNDGALPNWAAKFFIDAMLEKRTILDDAARVPT